MRVRCKDDNYVIAIKYAEVDGKRLLLKDFDNVWYYTNDFFHENIAEAKLSDLTIDGFVVVNTLHVKD